MRYCIFMLNLNGNVLAFENPVIWNVNDVTIIICAFALDAYSRSIKSISICKSCCMEARISEILDIVRLPFNIRRIWQLGKCTESREDTRMNPEKVSIYRLVHIFYSSKTCLNLSDVPNDGKYLITVPHIRFYRI